MSLLARGLRADKATPGMGAWKQSERHERDDEMSWTAERKEQTATWSQVSSTGAKDDCSWLLNELATA